MKCIICRREFDKLSDEHIFPDAIGGSLIVTKVCKSCNSKLGDEVDILLTNHYLITLTRNALRISGKSGIVPNPFKEGVTEDGQKIRLLMSEDGQLLPQFVPQLSEIEKDKVRIKIDSKDSDKLPDIIRKTFKRRGLDISEEEIEDILKNAGRESSQPTIKYDIAFDMINYKKALLKIAYEMGVYWLGEEYIQDPIGKEICKVIFSPINELKKSKIRGQIGLASEIDFPLFAIQELSTNHLAILIPDRNRLICILRIFNVFAAITVISENRDRYKNIRDGYFMYLDPVERNFSELSFIKAISKFIKE